MPMLGRLLVTESVVVAVMALPVDLTAREAPGSKPSSIECGQQDMFDGDVAVESSPSRRSTRDRPRAWSRRRG
jgi:hypothetical protein